MNVRVSPIIHAPAKARDFANIVISLIDPDTDLPRFSDGVVHKVFRMVDTDIQTDMFAPQFDDIADIFACVKHTDTDNVLVHCVGGISRSTAVGIGLLVLDGMSIDDAVSVVHSHSPSISPNKLILSHIDRLLGADGTFIDRVNKLIAALPKELILWCANCKTHFIDGQNCPGKHWA